MGWSEVSRATGATTFEAHDAGIGGFGRLEAGVLREWNEALLNLQRESMDNGLINRAARDATQFIFGAKVQIDAGSAQVSHDFLNGSVLRSNIDFTASILGIAGVRVSPQAAFYGLLGPSIGRETVLINFGGPITNDTHWTSGITAGLGTQVLLPSPNLSIGVEWQHTWWSGIDLNAPVASPGFNYHVGRESDTLGVTLRKKIN
jgi:opacity protein-like surface antigen